MFSNSVMHTFFFLFLCKTATESYSTFFSTTVYTRIINLYPSSPSLSCIKNTPFLLHLYSLQGGGGRCFCLKRLMVISRDQTNLFSQPPPPPAPQLSLPTEQLIRKKYTHFISFNIKILVYSYVHIKLKIY